MQHSARSAWPRCEKRENSGENSEWGDGAEPSSPSCTRGPFHPQFRPLRGKTGYTRRGGKSISKQERIRSLSPPSRALPRVISGVVLGVFAQGYPPNHIVNDTLLHAFCASAPEASAADATPLCVTETIAIPVEECQSFPLGVASRSLTSAVS